MVCLFTGFVVGFTSVHADERPNVLLILVDDLKPALGCYGDPIAKTPNIDALAARGMRFDLAFCNQAVCAPSRFTLMLGSHSTSTGLYGLGSPLRQVLPDAVTMPQYFAKHGGYRTESLGKVFHIGHGNYGDPESFSVPHFSDKVIEYLDPVSTQGGQLTREEAFFTNQKLGEIKSLPRGAAYESPQVDDDQYADGRVAMETVRRLQQAKERRASDGTPFFITAGFARPHLPFSAPKKYWDLFDPATLPLPQFEDHPADAPKVAGKRGGEITNYFPVPTEPSAKYTEELKRNLIHGYYASSSFVDAQIGKVIDELDRLQLAENTIVVLWGDHGFHLGDLGIWTKHTNYEQANRIPILISAPGVAKPGSSTNQPIESVDIFPTIAELAGLPSPTGPQPIDGLSLVSVLKNPDHRVRDHAFHAYPKKKLGRAIRTERYRLVQWKSGNAEDAVEYELYDYETDPMETRNLATVHRDVVDRLKQTLAKYPVPVGQESKKPKATSATKTSDPETTQIAKLPLNISGQVKADSGRGVIVAQGGREHGFAVHMIDGRVAFDVRVNGKVTRIIAKDAAPKQFSFLAMLGADRCVLKIDGKKVADGPSPGLIPTQPKDGLTVGRDELTAAGNYEAPNPFNGSVDEIKVATGQPVAAASKSNQPFASELITTWGEKVTAQNAWTEYPRPQLRREKWTNLNGRWDYAVTAIAQKETPKNWDGKILVPFCLESKLGGVQRLLDASESLWYHRTFTATPSSQRLRLNFEAVDYRCEVFVNGKRVGNHTGGNTPFSFDITEVIRSGENELVVRVEDATEAWQLRGKQVLEAKGIWYTQVSGVWQTVWLEEVASSHLADVKIATDADTGSIAVTPKMEGKGTVRVVVKDGGSVVAEGSGENVIVMKVPNAKLWSPASPHLYDIVVTLADQSGATLDEVKTYAGIRSVGKVKDAHGNWQFTLNGDVIFHWGPLDQGWWPDGLLTPPSDEAMLFDIEWLKEAGFNMIRKHIKVEPRRYYYHCDRLGMMVWQDQVSGGVKDKAWPEWTRLKPNPVDAEWPRDQHQQFMLELERMIDALENHPSIVSWVPFNERWGQHQTVEVGKWMVDRDPSRVINVASGGNFWPVGDVVDEHRYPHPGFPFELGQGGRFDDYIKVIGEFGGHGFPVKDHLWDANRRNWGYGDIPKTETEYKDRYATSIDMLNQLRGQGIAAGVYTQTTDVEGEINGLMTYDRKVIKIPAKELATLHEKLFRDAPKVESAAKAAKADQFPDSAFIEQATDRKPGPVMDAETIRAGLKSHDRALYIKAGWIRDPYITLGPDDYYYLTGTQPNEGDPREATNPYNIGLGDESIVGNQVRVYRSKDLTQWESLGVVFSTKDLFEKPNRRKGNNAKRIWAPEVHWMGDHWALVHCPKQISSLAVSAGKDLKGPWTHPMKDGMGERHDPSLFNDDGSVWMLWGNTTVAPLSNDLSKYIGESVRIDPSGTRPGPDGELINRIGHEGATMIKVGGKYVHLGTAWSTDQGRKGSYNLYYSVADKITGPYGPRQFAGRFLGHGTPFQDNEGKWWCTAFFNANVPPLSREGIEKRDIGDNAQTINEQGVTIVPLDVRTLDSGEVFIRAKDPAYASPGPDEAQKFDLVH
ncbi:sulfatase-like hydrolase/transferase [Rubripirellula tenax]|nr:sulfatase-like hydrolase/transferase [Rubripirellula tenax]